MANKILQRSSVSASRHLSCVHRKGDPLFLCTHITRRGAGIRKNAVINLILYPPKTEEGKEALARRVSDAHAAAVNQRLKSLNCPAHKKLELLDAVIKTAKSREQTV